jgi:hypothetical protein
VLVAGDSLLPLLLGTAVLALVSWLGATVAVVVPSETTLLLLAPGVPVLLVTPGIVMVLLVASVAEVLLQLPPGEQEELVSTGGLLLGLPGVLVDDSFTSEEVVVVLTGGVAVDGGLLVLVLGGWVLEAVLQSNEMVGTWMLQLGLGLLGWGG